MKESEFKMMAVNFDRVVVFRPGPDKKWRVFGYQDDNPALQNLVRSARQEAREFATVDSAMAFVRRAGYQGQVTVDEAFPCCERAAASDDADAAGPQ